jgi:hypothetical protein
VEEVERRLAMKKKPVAKAPVKKASARKVPAKKSASTARATAVAENLGATQSLRDFLSEVGWR